MLVPLYFRIAADLKLHGVGAATLIVTLYGATYNLGSWAGGIAADRFSRKMLLAIGLLGNAIAILGIGLSREYSIILALAMAAGLFGTIFHPAALAFTTSHYPKSPGLAIGLLSIGSGLGFFFGPQIAGWRAATATWQLWHVAQWQKPCVEMGHRRTCRRHHLPFSRNRCSRHCSSQSMSLPIQSRPQPQRSPCGTSRPFANVPRFRRRRRAFPSRDICPKRL